MDHPPAAPFPGYVDHETCLWVCKVAELSRNVGIGYDAIATNIRECGGPVLRGDLVRGLHLRYQRIHSQEERSAHCRQLIDAMPSIEVPRS